MTAKIKRRTITQMAKLPFLPRKPVLWRRSSSIGIYPALKLLLCSLLTFLRSTAFSRIDFFTGPLELCCNTKHGLAVVRHVNPPKRYAKNTKWISGTYYIQNHVILQSAAMYLHYTTTAISSNALLFSLKWKYMYFQTNCFSISFLSWQELQLCCSTKKNSCN